MYKEMTSKNLTNSSCSLARVVDVVGDQWTLLIIREAFLGVTTFSGFRNELGISRNILVNRLNILIENNVFLKEKIRDKRYRYSLTPSGRELLPALVALLQWGDKWIFGSEGEPIVVLDKENKAPIQRMGIFSNDGRFLDIEDLMFEIGPGGVGKQEIQSRLQRIGIK